MLASGESYANYSMAFTEASAKLYNHCFYYSLRLVDLALVSQRLAKQNMKFQVPVTDSRLKTTTDIVALNLLDFYVFHYYYSFFYFNFYLDFYSIQL